MHLIYIYIYIYIYISQRQRFHALSLGQHCFNMYTHFLQIVKHEKKYDFDSPIPFSRLNVDRVCASYTREINLSR